MSGRNNDTAIEEGKVSGNTITGKSESQRGGQALKRDWVAKKEPAAK